MGRDNHPRERQARKLARKKASRGPYPRVLIVSEGEKTEPNYFEEIRREFRLHTANVWVLPSEAGTNPVQIVQFAEDAFRKSGKAFDQVYAVFDRDDHLRFDEALEKAAALDGKLRSDEKEPVPFQVVPSIPCFELWLLLHYIKITHRIHRVDVIRTLKKYLLGYEKGTGGHYEATKHLLEVAYVNADALDELKASEGKDFPSTAIPSLVRLLTTMKE
jgi:hypothetical protein